MIFGKIQGEHPFSDGLIRITNDEGRDFYLQVAPSKTKNPYSPPFQLVFKESGHPFHDTRITGLFQISPNRFGGDVQRNGKKTRFEVSFDSELGTATITKK